MPEQTPGLYVPQLGDAVVYLQDGHRAYFAKLSDKRRGPWDAIVSTEVSGAQPEPCCSPSALSLPTHTAAPPGTAPMRHEYLQILMPGWVLL